MTTSCRLALRAIFFHPHLVSAGSFEIRATCVCCQTLESRRKEEKCQVDPAVEPAIRASCRC